MFESLNPLMMLDSAAGQAAVAIEESGLDTAALNSEIQEMRKFALIVVFSLVQAIVENELDEDELPSDRLSSLIAGFSADTETDEEIEVDQATLDIFIANVQDALESLGVDQSVIKTMFGDGEEAEEAIEAAAETVESNTPQGGDLDEFIDLFVYGEAEEDDGVMLDGVALGKTTTKSGKFGKVVYKAVKAIRNGKVAIVNKRMSGKVKLSAKQRAALNKARRKATTGAALKKRMRSMKKAKQMNI